MPKVLRTPCRLLKDQQGITAVEYALLLGLIGGAVVLAAAQLGQVVENQMQETETTLTESP